MSSTNSPYSSSFGGPSSNGSAYSYATMLPQHDPSIFSTPTGNTMRVHQDYISANNSSPPSLGRDYQTMVTHSSPQHLASSISEDEHQNKQLDYVNGLSPTDKYQHEQAEYCHQHDQKQDYGMHSPSNRQSLKDQVLIKTEPSGQQSYVQLPPFLNWHELSDTDFTPECVKRINYLSSPTFFKYYPIIKLFLEMLLYTLTVQIVKEITDIIGNWAYLKFPKCLIICYQLPRIILRIIK